MRASRPASAVLSALAALLVLVLAPAPDAHAAGRGRNGTIVLRCPVKGASVYVDGEEVGTLPVEPLSVPAGRRSIRIVRSGVIDFRRDVTVKPGERVVVSAQPQGAAPASGDDLGLGGLDLSLDVGTPAPAPAPGADLGSLDLTLEPLPAAPKPGHADAPPAPATSTLDLAMSPVDLAPPAPEPRSPSKPPERLTNPAPAASMAPAPVAAAPVPAPAPATPPKAPAAKPPPAPPPAAFTAAPVLPETEPEPEEPAGPPVYTRPWFKGAVGGVLGAGALSALAAYVIVPAILYGDIGSKPYAERRDPGAKCPDCLIVLNK